MNIKTTLLLSVAILTACTVGKDYARPPVEKPAEFKESKDWKQAQPKDETVRGKWWEIFNDADLNKLEEQVETSNQNVKFTEAQYHQARALVSEAKSAYFPTVGANAGVNRGQTGRLAADNQFSATLDAAWELDLWGGIRRNVEANEANAKASAADLAAIKLSMGATLASDYFNLRIADEQKRLLDETVTNYEKSMKLTENLYNSGVQARADVLQAKTQLESAQAQAIDIGVQRAVLEHAIAILVGKAPADFKIEPVNSVPAIPFIPLKVPSEVLERRPDIAASERRVIAANAQIGVAKAAYYPTLTLSASGGYQSSSASNWFNLPNRIWSIGPNLAETIFDAGLRRAQTKAAIAVYDQTVATYRQTVLNSFQEVEDNLATLRILQEEAEVEQKAVADANASTTIFLNQYKSGIVSYLSVVTAQNTELSNKLTALNIQKSQLTAAATLVKALGGGWDPKKQ